MKKFEKLQCIISIISTLLIVIAIFIAWRALEETTKARQDIFLPIIIVDGVIFDNFHRQMGVDIRNTGKGIAFNIKIMIQGLTKFNERKTLQVGDTHRWHIIPTKEKDMSEIDDLEGRKGIILLISYEDVHHRKIKTKYYGQHVFYKHETKEYSRIEFDLVNFEYCPP